MSSQIPKVVSEMLGQQYNRWTVLEWAGSLYSKNGNVKQRLLKCQCECGTVKVVRHDIIKLGNTKSCGCLQREITIDRNTKHGLRSHPLYYTWDSMNQRCHDPNHKKYHHYHNVLGAFVQENWRKGYPNSLANFIEYIERELGPKPSPEHTLDRIKNKGGGYTEGNLKWSTKSEQCQNREYCHGLMGTYLYQRWNRAKADGRLDPAWFDFKDMVADVGLPPTQTSRLKKHDRYKLLGPSNWYWA